MSVDGFIDDTSAARLILSNEKDFDRVDQVRADCDAILIGAGTLRADDPSLLIKSEQRQLDRIRRGLPGQPIKVTLTASGNIPKPCKFLSTGDSEKIIYCSTTNVDQLRLILNGTKNALAVPLSKLSPHAVLSDLSNRGVKRLLVEGGSKVATTFLADGSVDELQVSIAPFFVGETNAPRFTQPAKFLNLANKPMQLKSVEQFDNVVLLTYLLSRPEWS